MEPPILSPQFVTNESGERIAVILSMAEFEEISELLEDVADAKVIELRRHERSIPHAEAMRLAREDGDIPD